MIKIITDKQKILQYLENKGISKNKFYVKTGLSIGFLDSGSSLGVDKLRIIIDNYPDLNVEWVVLDKGSMLKSDVKSSLKQNITGDGNIQSGNDTNITGDYVKQIKTLELELQECKTKLEEKDKTISQLVNLMSSK